MNGPCSTVLKRGMVTYAADMLDADAQAFWGRILLS